MPTPVVQRRAKGSTGSVASLTIDGADGWSAPTVGNTIVVFGNSDATMSASGYTLVQSVIDGNGAYCWVKAADGSESAITVVPGVTARTAMAVYEVAGALLPVDASDQTLITGSNGLVTQAVSIATTGPGIIFAAALLHGYTITDPATPSWSNSFSQQLVGSSAPLSSTSDVTIFVGELITVAGGSYSTVCTWTGSQAADRQHIIVGLKESAPAATNAPADLTSGTGSSPDALAALAANAPADAGTGSALAAVSRISPVPAAVTGTGSAPAALATSSANAAVATGAGSAPDATISTANAVDAPAAEGSGSGQAPDALGTVTAGPGEGAGAGAAPDATVSSSSSTSAPAEAPTGVGSAPVSAVALTVPAAEATGAGAALDATVSSASSTSAAAELATGTGAAPNGLIAVTVSADIALAAGSAIDPAVAATAAPLIAAGAGSAADPVVVIAYPAYPGAAAGAGQALDASVLLAALPGPAAGVGAALDALAAALSEVVPFLDVDSRLTSSTPDSGAVAVTGEPDARPVVAGVTW